LPFLLRYQSAEVGRGGEIKLDGIVKRDHKDSRAFAYLLLQIMVIVWAQWH
tara:strand:+ start:230 stop:382 length:153 start_codon:yes stop_codon:yes gene_type:complete